LVHLLNWHCNELFALVMYKIMKHRGRMLQAQFTLAAVPYECAVQRDAGATSTWYKRIAYSYGCRVSFCQWNLGDHLAEWRRRTRRTRKGGGGGGSKGGGFANQLIQLAFPAPPGARGAGVPRKAHGGGA